MNSSLEMQVWNASLRCLVKSLVCKRQLTGLCSIAGQGRATPTIAATIVTVNTGILQQRKW